MVEVGPPPSSTAAQPQRSAARRKEEVKMQTTKRRNPMVSVRIILMVYAALLILAHPSNAQMVLTWDAKDEPTMTEYCAVVDSIKKEKVKLVPSCDKFLDDARAIFKDAVPTGTVKKIGEHNYSEVQAKVRRIASVMAPFSNTSYPAACLPGVKTYIAFKGSKERPLKLAQNFAVWQGTVYLDGEGNVFLSENTSYRLDGVDRKAKGGMPAQVAEVKPTPKGRAIPREFYGTWIEIGDEGKELGRMKVKNEAIEWKAPNASMKRISATELTISEDHKTLSFTSDVVIAEGALIPAAAIIGKPKVQITREGGNLLVKMGKVKLKSEARGLFKWKGGTSISFEVIDGKEVAVITRPEEVHHYQKSK